VLYLLLRQQSEINSLLQLNLLQLLPLFVNILNTYLFQIAFRTYIFAGFMLKQRLLPVPDYGYAKWFCLLRLWAWTFNNIDAMEVLQLLLLVLSRQKPQKNIKCITTVIVIGYIADDRTEQSRGVK